MRVGMEWFVENVPDRAEFDQFSSIENRNPITSFSDNPEIMRDEQERHVIRLLQFLENLENLGLDDHIERGRRLIRDKQGWPQNQSECDHDALAHPPGELVRIVSDARLMDSH